MVHRIRALGAALIAAGAGGLVCWLLWLGMSGAWADLQRPVPLADDVVALLAAGAGLVLTGWLSLGALLTAAALVARGGLDGATLLARTARAVTPELVRRTVAMSVGVSVGVTLVVGATATGSQATPGSTPADPRSTPAARIVDQIPALDVGWGVPGPAPVVPPAAGTGAPGVVVVRPGDTLWGLARRDLGPRPGHPGRAASAAEIARAWPGWFTANRATIGPDPDHLEPGQRLVRPSQSASADRRPR